MIERRCARCLGSQIVWEENVVVECPECRGRGWVSAVDPTRLLILRGALLGAGATLLACVVVRLAL